MLFIYQFDGTASNGDFFGPPVQLVPPVTFRARSKLEPALDLQHPEYSNSTIPIVFHPTWMHNYYHVAMSSTPWVYNNINQSDDADLALRAQLVVRTPHGWDMPPFLRPLLQPLLHQPITTLAELSARPEQGSKQSRRRCFCDMLFCSSYDHTKSPNGWHATQALAASYTPGGGQAAASTGVHRIMFHTRSVAVRQFVNQAELLEKCSRWACCQEGQGRAQHVNCSTIQFTDVPSSIAAAQAADVFLGIHGANMANAFFMRPGSALVEVMHPDWPHRFNWLLEQDPTHKLIYFGLIVNKSHWTPGVFEQQQREAGLTPYDLSRTISRDRNVNLKQV